MEARADPDIQSVDVMSEYEHVSFSLGSMRPTDRYIRLQYQILL